MLIPSIDLKNGKVVQLIQGERLAIESDDLDGWIARFARFPKVQLIDLDAAMGSGSNDALVRRVAVRLPCRVGGGIRSVRPGTGGARPRRARRHRQLSLIPRWPAGRGVR